MQDINPLLIKEVNVVIFRPRHWSRSRSGLRNFVAKGMCME
jgi:hypothetical protein